MQNDIEAIGQIPTAADSVIGRLQASVIDIAQTNARAYEADKPTGIKGFVHRLLDKHFQTGEIHDADQAIEELREKTQDKVQELEHVILEKRRQAKVIMAFLGIREPGSEETVEPEQPEPDKSEALSADEVRAVRSQVGFIGVALAIDREESLRTDTSSILLYDSKNPSDPVEHNSGRAVVATLQALGFEAENFAKTDTAEDEATVLEAIIPAKDRLTSRSTSRRSKYSAAPGKAQELLATYRQDDSDVSVSITIRHSRSENSDN